MGNCSRHNKKHKGGSIGDIMKWIGIALLALLVLFVVFYLYSIISKYVKERNYIKEKQFVTKFLTEAQKEYDKQWQAEMNNKYHKPPIWSENIVK